MHNGFDPTTTDGLPERLRDQVAKRSRVLGPGYQLFYETPVEVVSGQGAHLFGPDGEDYLDAYNNVPSVGHCHPKVVEAISRQAATLNTNTRYVQEPLTQYAEDLLGTFDGDMSRLSFTTTGSEANDLAYRVARHETGATGVIVTSNAYHGLTDSVASFSPSLGPGSPLGSYVRTVELPDSLRSDKPAGEILLQRVQAAIEDLQRHGHGVAALFIDTIFSSDGVFADPPGFLNAAVATVQEAGGFVVADEVQPGFTRTGTHWWGYQRHGFRPDMVTMGKPMANGQPLAALALRDRIGDAFGRHVRYFNTYGGNSVSIAAARSVLDILSAEGSMASIHETGEFLRTQLRAAAAGEPRIAEVRGAGLFIGVEVVKDEHSLEPDPTGAAYLTNALRERRVLISASGRFGNTLKVRPPLCFDRDDAQRLLDTFASVIASWHPAAG